MARPPKIPNWLPDHQPTIYFVTFCTKNRARVLATVEVFEVFHRACEEFSGWCILSAVLMPDHVHMLAAPSDRGASVKNLVAGLRKKMRRANPEWQWQEGCFDPLLRSDESAQQKWEYVRENPVRAGLVKEWSLWPFRYDSVNL